MQAVIAFLVAFSTIVFLINRRVQLGWAMFTGAVILGLLGGLGPMATFRHLLAAALDARTLNLMLVISLVWVLGSIMRGTGSLKVMIESLLGLLPDRRFVIAVIPAVVGLLNVPGGAVLSAPMIAEVGEEAGLNPEARAAANVVFRHLFYPVFPLYPTLIFTIGVTGVPMAELIRLGLVPVLLSGLIAFYVLFRGARRGGLSSGNRVAALGSFLRCTAPISVTLLLALTGLLPFPLAVSAGILVALLNYLPSVDISSLVGEISRRIHQYGVRDFRFEPVFAVLGVMVFREVIEASGVVQVIAGDMMDLRVPTLALLVAMPAVTGVVTGTNLGAIGITMPVLTPLLESHQLVPGVFLVFMAGCAGYYVSPLHLCVVLTREYYKARVGGIYHLLLPPTVVLVVSSIVIAVLWGL